MNTENRDPGFMNNGCRIPCETCCDQPFVTPPNRAPLVTLNRWNEWTEGSYFPPDMRWGYGCLRAVRNVLGGHG